MDPTSVERLDGIFQIHEPDSIHVYIIGAPTFRIIRHILAL